MVARIIFTSIALHVRLMLRLLKEAEAVQLRMAIQIYTPEDGRETITLSQEWWKK